jgi:hypothetical protein
MYYNNGKVIFLTVNMVKKLYVAVLQFFFVQKHLIYL